MADMVGDIVVDMVVDMMVIAAVDVIGTDDNGEADVPVGNSVVTGGNIMLATDRTSRLSNKVFDYLFGL